MRFAWLATALVAASAASASAAPPAYRIVTKDFQQWVVQGSRSAPLGIGGSLDGDAAKIDTHARTVSFDVLPNCGSDRTYTFSFDQVDARLANAEALTAHHKKQWAKAAAGFANAVRLDPTWRLPAYNLASARTELGDQAGAVAALAPWLASEPVATYLDVTFDHELQPLLATKELAAIRSPVPGNVRVSVNGMDARFGIDPTGSLVAGVIEDSNGMSCEVTTSIALFDAKTGAVIQQLPLASHDGCQAGAPALISPKRDEQLQKLMSELGIASTPSESGSSAFSKDGQRRVVRLPKSKLGVVEAGGGVNVLSGDRILATGGMTEPRLVGATFVPAARLMVVQSYHPSDSCPDNGLDAVKVPL